MKRISNQIMQIQLKDLIALNNYGVEIPREINEIMFKAVVLGINQDQYIEIVDRDSIDYLSSINWILNVDDIARLTNEEIDMKMNDILLDMEFLNNEYYLAKSVYYPMIPKYQAKKYEYNEYENAKMNRINQKVKSHY